MSTKSLLLLISQFLCFGFLLLYLEWPGNGFYFILQVAGIVLCLWSILVMGLGNFNAQPEVKSGAVLIRKGPYSVIRNPMYAGLLLFFGSGVADDLVWQGLLVFVGLCLTFALKIRDEEKYLTERFGETYLAYKRKSSRIIPYVF
jgi:protein-S-isoprenylcysteine O-methyltransferase Ste14